MAACQVIGFDCPDADLCKNCNGTGTEPVGTDLLGSCDRCFDDEVGWSTGVEPGTESARTVRATCKVLEAEGDE